MSEVEEGERVCQEDGWALWRRIAFSTAVLELISFQLTAFRHMGGIMMTMGCDRIPIIVLRRLLAYTLLIFIYIYILRDVYYEQSYESN